MKRILIPALLLFTGAPARAGCGDPQSCVRHYATHYRVSPDFIAALIDVESGWDPRCVEQGSDGIDAADAGNSTPIWRL